MREKTMKVRVSCYAGYRGEETPIRLYLGDRPIDIKRVEDRWLAPDHRYFKVIGDDEALYILRHDSSAGTWGLVYYQCSGFPGQEER